MKLPLILILITIAVAGCTTRRSYLATFDPRVTVCDLAYPGYDCAANLGGDIGVTGGGFTWGGQPDESQTAVSEAFALTDGLNADFDTDGFMRALADRVARDLKTAGFDSDLAVTGSDAVVDYHAASTRGHLELKAHRAPGMLVVDVSGHEGIEK